jgi:DNA repair photolyase
MPVIYEPRGKAREDCERAVNLFHGCDHGCLYCYAPSATYKTREEFAMVRNRPGIVEQIRKEAPAHKDCEVLLCFTCDAYSKFASYTDITRQAIKSLHAGGCKVTILTKGGLRSLRDFDILHPGDKYGATLTFMTDGDTCEWEPGAASPAERMFCLEEAHKRGITTWVSLEPVIDPEASLALIEYTSHFVDFFKVGRWNYDRRANEIDWGSFVARALAMLKKYKKQYMIKKDLAVFLKEAA